MLVKYYMNSTCTYANFLADINGIVNGSITSTGSLSAGANTSLTTFTGTYPAGVYALANNAGTYTYLKTYNANTSTNCYFTIGFNGSNGIANVTLGTGYANATNTYSASNTYIFPFPLTIQNYSSIDIIMNNNLFYIGNPSTGSYGLGIFDVGYNGVSQAFPNAMVNIFLPVVNTISLAAAAQPAINPYSYFFSNAGYATTNTYLTYIIPTTSPYNAVGNVAVVENPVFTYNPAQGNAVSLIYGLNSIVQGEYIPRTVYVDTNSVYRYVVGTDAQTFSITLT
jgi:hypothetical protein